MDADLERILAENYLDGLAACDVGQLRARRAECRQVEGQLSYLRRLVQGRHDIVAGEMGRRAGGGDPDDVHGLVEQLPGILADRVRGPGSGRLPDAIVPLVPTGRLVDRLDAIDEAVPLDTPHGLDDAHLADAEEQLRTLEREVSTLRRSMFERLDVIEAELTGRYASGEAHVDDLLVRPTD